MRGEGGKSEKIEAVYQLRKTSDYSQNDPPGPEQHKKKQKSDFFDLRLGV